MTLRFVEEWEYHEIAAAQGDPHRHRSVESVQLQEKTGAALEPGPGSGTKGCITSVKLCSGETPEASGADKGCLLL